MSISNTAVVIPAYNEERHIKQVIADVKKYVPAKDIIVVSDGSKDMTVSIATKEQVTVLANDRNNGKGYVARQGCDLAYNKGYEHIILIDADGQHLASDIPRFLAGLASKDIVFGYRKGSGMPLRFRIGNFGLSAIIFFCSGKRIKDTQSGYRAFTRKMYERMRWEANNYFMETEMIMKLGRANIAQIPIKMIYHDAKKGTTVATGFRIFFDLVQYMILGIIGKRKKRKGITPLQ